MVVTAIFDHAFFASSAADDAVDSADDDGISAAAAGNGSTPILAIGFSNVQHWAKICGHWKIGAGSQSPKKIFQKLN